MFENLGRKLKIGKRVKILSKPYRLFPEARSDLPLNPPADIVGKEGVVTGKVTYYNLPWIPSSVINVDGKDYNIDVTYLRAANTVVHLEEDYIPF